MLRSRIASTQRSGEAGISKNIDKSSEESTCPHRQCLDHTTPVPKISANVGWAALGRSHTMKLRGVVPNVCIAEWYWSVRHAHPKEGRPEWPQKQAEQTKMMHAHNQTVPTVSLAIRIPVPFQSCPSHCWPTHIAHWQSANISTVGMLLTVCAGSRGEQRETIIENYDQASRTTNLESYRFVVQYLLPCKNGSMDESIHTSYHT